jgi:hypothetical protein
MPWRIVLAVRLVLCVNTDVNLAEIIVRTEAAG